jgi:tRNA A37 threonylcarbamoyladenosine synthetase subunit TsaC/SUA5/YrdC
LGEDEEIFSDPELIHDHFEHLVDVVIDGEIGGSIPSTIVDCTKNPPEIIRMGLGEMQ